MVTQVARFSHSGAWQPCGLNNASGADVLPLLA
jgi:hypothetical protein